MENETQKWWQSRTVRSLLALVLGSISYLAASLGFIDWEDLNRAQTVYPDVSSGIVMVQAGQWLAGVTLIGSALAIYFRVNATKFIS